MHKPTPEAREISSVAVLLLTTALIAFNPGRTLAATQSNPPPAAAATPKPARQLYQCPMHPNVVSDQPGRCPICGMELQPVKQVSAQGIPGRAPVQLTALQEQLINIRTVPVERIPLLKTIRTVGRVVVDEARTATLNSRVEGWVEKLEVATTGATVAQGQPLLQIYSPALYSAQQDFLILAHRHRADGTDGGLFEAARQRLELWGISDAQIRQLEHTGRPSYTLTLTAPVGGTVIEKPVVDAQMVKPGMPLYRIADLSKVWVLAELFESDLPLVALGQEAVVTIPAYPGRELRGQVDFIYPFLQAKTRTDQARLVFPNPDGLLKPDMYVNVRLERNLGAPLSVPTSAIFNTGNRQYVFVETQPGMFVPVNVELGPQAGQRQVLLRGVAEGDRVVVDGNFLLDSESQLRAAASDSGAGTTPGPTTPAATPSPAGATANHPMPASATEPVTALLRAYAQMHDGLFHDSLSASAPSARSMRAAVATLAAPDLAPADSDALYTRKLAALQQSLSGAPPADLTAARKQFGEVSAALIDLLRAFPPPLAHPLTIMHCPMWTGSPADWLQTAAATENPFYGQQMPTCGTAAGMIGKVH